MITSLHTHTHTPRWLLLLAGWLWSAVAMGQIQVCIPPKTYAQTSCGGVVTMGLDSNPATNTTYTWNLGNGATATGPGPVTTIYAGAGPYTVTLTATSPFRRCTSTFSVTPNQGGGCCPSGIAASNLLGNVGTTTVLAPGTYSGTYRVLGDLLLTNGSYTLTPGTVFYVDGQASKSPQRQVTGASITLGASASLVLDGATLTASGSGPGCPMWRGLVLDNGGQGPGGTYRLVMRNNSTISHALCGIDMPAIVPTPTGATEYSIDNSTFAHNLTHVRDNSEHAGNLLSRIAGCSFTSDPAQMHYPYDATSASDQFYTHQALLLTPSYNPNSVNYVLDVYGNTLTQALYGIVNNLFDRAGVDIHDNNLSDIYHTGIWVNDNLSQPIAPATSAVIRNNKVSLNSAPGRATGQIDPKATLYGILGETTHYNHSNSFVENYVRGDGLNQKPLIGMALNNAIDASGNRVANVTEGIRTTTQDGALFDNIILESDKGIVLADGGSSSYQTTIGCNTFSSAKGYSMQYALEVQPGAYLYDQGSPGSPAANHFEGNINEAIHNDGVTSFDYWYATSLQEQFVVANSNLGSNVVTVLSATAPASGWTNYCSNVRGATTGNGVNARGAVLSAASLAALADSVRLRRVPPARRRAYLYQVLDSYQTTGQLAALEAWWTLLLLPNAEDYRTVGLALLRAYDAQPAPAAAQRVLALLQPQALLNAEVAAALRYRTVRQHLPLTTPRLASADSTILRTLAWSGTSLAERAGQWLRYFHPRIPLPAPKAHVAHATSRTALAKAGVTGAVLGVAYPNPTQDEATISYQLPKATTMAELSFTDLLTGRVQLTLPLKADSSANAQTVQVSHLPAGHYMYRLLVNGQPVAIPQRLVVR